MKKQMLSSFVVLVIGLFLMVPLAIGKMTIKLGHVDRGNRQESVMEAFAGTFKDIVESRSGGEMEVLIYPAGQLGNMREMVESTQMGAIQIVLSTSSVTSGFSPKAELLMAPFVFPTTAHAWHAIDGWFGRELSDAILKDSKLRVLGYAEANGFRDSWIAKRPARKAGDFKGMKIRVPESKLLVTFVSALGASPAVVPWTELYTSMQTGVVDAFECEPGALVDQKLYETIKYGLLTHHGYTANYALANEDWFTKLSGKNKEIVINATRAGTTASRDVSVKNYGSALKLIKSKGVDIHTPTNEEFQTFVKMCEAPCLSYFEKTVGKEWVQKLLRASREAEAALARK